MSVVYEQARALMRSLRESDEYRQLKRLGAHIKSDSKTEAFLAELRKVQLESRAAQLQGQQLGSDQQEKFQRLMQRLEHEQAVKEYMKAEYAYGQGLAEVQQIMAEAFNPDVPSALR